MKRLIEILIPILLVWMCGCSAETRDTIKVFHEGTMQTLKEGKFVGHYRLHGGRSEVGLINGFYLDPGLEVDIDGNFDFKTQ